MGLAALVAKQVAAIPAKLGTLAPNFTLHKTSRVYDAATGNNNVVSSDIALRGVISTASSSDDAGKASRYGNLKVGLAGTYDVEALVFYDANSASANVADEMTVNGLRYNIKEIVPVYVGLTPVIYTFGLSK